MMKTYYHVSGKDIFVKNEDKSLKSLSNDDILGSLAYTPEDADEDDAYIIFDNLEAAKQIALDGQEEHPLEAFPILVLTVEDDAELVKIRVNKEFDIVEKGGFKALEVHANQAKFISASLKHVSPEIDDFVFDADLYKQVQQELAANPEKPAKPDSAASSNSGEPVQSAKFNLLDSLKSLKKLAPVAAVGTIGVGFWQSGAIPGVASLIGNTVGVAIPMIGTAGIVAQVAIAAAVGALAYAAAKGLLAVGKAGFNAAKTALAARKTAKTAKAQYEADKAAAAKDVAVLEKALGYDDQNDIFAKLATFVSKAPDAAFEGEDLAKEEAQPKGLNQLQVLQKEKQLLADIKAANDAKDDAKRQELEGKIAKRGFKISST